MDFLRRSCGRSRLERVRNDDIRMQMHMERHIHEDIEKRQLTWFGHVKRMNADRWPRKVLEWMPLERRKRGRPRRSWRDDINQAMAARSLAEDEVFDRKRWKLGTERRQQLQKSPLTCGGAGLDRMLDTMFSTRAFFASSGLAGLEGSTFGEGSDSVSMPFSASSISSDCCPASWRQSFTESASLRSGLDLVSLLLLFIADTPFWEAIEAALPKDEADEAYETFSLVSEEEMDEWESVQGAEEVSKAVRKSTEGGDEA
nr:unnamed protein product [Callosobruchus analis]